MADGEDAGDGSPPYRPVRMDDVARHAGVSLGTVSHALNHPHRLAPRTLARVQAAIDELGFVPDRRARSLAGGASSMIGFVVVDLTNSYFVDMARGAEDEASADGMNVVLGNADVSADKERTYLDLFDQEHVAGVLLTPSENRADVVWQAPAGNRRLVLLNTEGEVDRCSVIPDDELGGYLAARHLIDTGRRRLAFVGGPFFLAPIAKRLRGAERAVAESGGAVTLTVVTTDGLRPHHGREVGRRLIGLPDDERPDGLVAAADLVALGVVQELVVDRRIRVPEDLAIVGYDNNQASWESSIPLTTIAQPGYEVGRTATRLLIEEIRDPDRHLHQRVRIAPQLIVRDSSPHA